MRPFGVGGIIETFADDAPLKRQVTRCPPRIDDFVRRPAQRTVIYDDVLSRYRERSIRGIAHGAGAGSGSEIAKDHVSGVPIDEDRGLTSVARGELIAYRDTLARSGLSGVSEIRLGGS